MHTSASPCEASRKLWYLGTLTWQVCVCMELHGTAWNSTKGHKIAEVIPTGPAQDSAGPLQWATQEQAGNGLAQCSHHSKIIDGKYKYVRHDQIQIYDHALTSFSFLEIPASFTPTMTSSYCCPSQQKHLHCTIPCCMCVE